MDPITLALVLIMGSMILGLILTVLILIGRLLKKEHGTRNDPYLILNSIYSEDRNRNGIPDHIENMMRNMKMNTSPGSSHSTSLSFKIQRGDRTWGRMERVVDGKKVVHQWGEPVNKNEEIFKQYFDLYVNGKITDVEFRKKMDLIK